MSGIATLEKAQRLHRVCLPRVASTGLVVSAVRPTLGTIPVALTLLALPWRASSLRPLAQISVSPGKPMLMAVLGPWHFPCSMEIVRAEVGGQTSAVREVVQSSPTLLAWRRQPPPLTCTFVTSMGHESSNATVAAP